MFGSGSDVPSSPPGSTLTEGVSGCLVDNKTTFFRNHLVSGLSGLWNTYLVHVALRSMECGRRLVYRLAEFHRSGNQVAAKRRTTFHYSFVYF